MENADNAPLKATAHEGAVLIDGPGGIVATFTPEAADVSGERMMQAAIVAAEQRRQASDRVRDEVSQQLKD